MSFGRLCPKTGCVLALFVATEGPDHALLAVALDDSDCAELDEEGALAE